MIELLAVPEWNAPPRTLADWVDRLAREGRPPRVQPESSDAAWLELPDLSVRGYALLEDRRVTAIHFELEGEDVGPAQQLLTTAAGALGWEIHADEDGDDTDEDAD